MPPPIRTADGGREATARAVTILAAGDTTRHLLKEKLLRAGFTPEASETACARMVELKYLDEPAFAARVMEKRVAQGKAPAFVVAELQNKGVSQATIRETLDAVNLAQVEAQAHEMAVRLWQKHAGNEESTRYRRALGGLARRGFSEGLARRALAAAKSSG